MKCCPLLFFCVYAATGAGLSKAGPHLELSGSLKNLLAVTDVANNYRNLGVINRDLAVDDIHRIRLKISSEPSERWSLGMHYEIRAAWGDTERIRNNVQQLNTDNPFGTAILRSRPLFLDLESAPIEESNFMLAHRFDRLQVRWQTHALDLTLGRQAVSWGSGLLWTPTDLFSGFAPTEIDRDEKQGVDVARLIWTATESSYIDIVAEPLDEDGPYAINPNDSSLAARGTSHIGEIDLSALAGLLAGDMVVGGDFSGYLINAGLRGEWIYTWVDEDDERDYFRGLVSLDYGFARTWNPYVAIEYLYNGIGTSDPDGYLWRLSQTSVQRAFGRGNAFNIGRHYLGSIARLTPSALVSLSSTTLWNLEDSSVREFIAMGWSMRENLDLQLGMNIGFGRLGTEFRGFSKDQAGVDFESPNLYFAFCTFYF